MLKNLNFVGLGSSPTMPTSMKRDMHDIYEMRFTGLSYAAFEARAALIQMDDLILDAEDGETPSVLQNRVTDHYWKRFAWDVSRSFEMYGFVLWGVRKERVYAGDDGVRKAKYGDFAEDYVNVAVPYMIPFFAVPLGIKINAEKDFREEVIPLDDYGRSRKDVTVSYSRRGRASPGMFKFETDCGALLEDWRRMRELTRVHDEVVRSNAEVAPYVEHMTETEQARLHEEARILDAMLNNPTPAAALGLGFKMDKVLTKVDDKGNPESKVCPFVQVPENRKISSVQPIAKISFNKETEDKRWLGQLAATLRVPLRHLQSEDNRGLGASGNEATVQDDVTRAVRAAQERRDEIVDVLADAHMRVYGARPRRVHLPTVSHMKPLMLLDLHDRGLMSDRSVKDELSAALGIKRARFGDSSSSARLGGI